MSNKYELIEEIRKLLPSYFGSLPEGKDEAWLDMSDGRAWLRTSDGWA